jgi:hypothetical protein
MLLIHYEKSLSSFAYKETNKILAKSYFIIVCYYQIKINTYY